MMHQLVVGQFQVEPLLLLKDVALVGWIFSSIMVSVPDRFSDLHYNLIVFVFFLCSLAAYELNGLVTGFQNNIKDRLHLPRATHQIWCRQY